MKAYILVQEKKIGEAIKRFLKNIINASSEIYSFEEINTNFPDIADTNEYDLAIANIYDFSNKKYTSNGFTYMESFIEEDIPVIFFYYDNHLKSEYSLKDLPDNCFYLPFQIHKFLEYIKNPSKPVKPLNSLRQMFRSHGLTSGH